MNDYELLEKIRTYIQNILGDKFTVYSTSIYSLSINVVYDSGIRKYTKNFLLDLSLFNENNIKAISYEYAHLIQVYFYDEELSEVFCSSNLG